MDSLSLKELFAGIFIVLGCIFMCIASLGIIRLPDFYIRNSAITKAAILGVGFIFAAVAIFFNDIWIIIKVFGISVFILLASPVSAHVISRAAFKNKVPFWKRTNLNEFPEGRIQEEKPDTKLKR